MFGNSIGKGDKWKCCVVIIFKKTLLKHTFLKAVLILWWIRSLALKWNVSNVAITQWIPIPVPLSPEFISRPFCLWVRVGSSSPFCFPSSHILASVPLSLPLPLLNFDRPSPSWPLPFSKDIRLKKRCHHYNVLTWRSDCRVLRVGSGPVSVALLLI